MDLQQNYNNYLNIISSQNHCPNITNQQTVNEYITYCENTKLTNISNYNTINFEKLISIYIEYQDNEELKKRIEKIFSGIAENYKFKVKKKHHISLNNYQK